MDVIRPLMKVWHRSEVPDSRHLPARRALVVSNHPAECSRWTSRCSPPGSTRSSVRPADLHPDLRPRAGRTHRQLLPKSDRIHQANHEKRRRGAALGRRGRGVPRRRLRRLPAQHRAQHHRLRFTAPATSGPINAGVPIVPVVGIGGQESQIYLTHGTEVAKLLRLDKLFRPKIRGEPASVRAVGRARSTCHRPPRSCSRSSTLSTSSPSSARTPTSTRSTPTSAGSCRPPR